MSFLRTPFSQRSESVQGESEHSGHEHVVTTNTLDDGHISDGSSLQYIEEKGGNDAPPTYQEAGGAPVESRSPLGYHVGAISIYALNISQMVGTGIYSTPSSILSGTGSVGLSLIFWVIGFFMSIANASVYLEFASYFPSRSGSEVVYLEQAFPKPRFLVPTTFAVQNIILSFSASNAVVLANYLFKTAGKTGTSWEVKGVALAGYTVAFLLCVFNTRVSYFINNSIGFIKLGTLVFVAITGLVVLGGNTRVADPHANFRNAFDGAPTPYGITIALYRIIFSYSGYNNAFNVVNEVKNPIKKIRLHGLIALLIVTVLYMLANIAYFAAVPKAEIEAGSTTVASLFFTAVFGNKAGVRGLNILIALSAFGNLIAVMLGQARVVRETGRQGVLPFTNFWVSTWPFGTPFGPYFLKWSLTVIVILAVPTGDAFNFFADLGTLPSAVFSFLMAVGLYVVRWRRKKANLPEPDFKAWHVLVIFNILIQAYCIVMPWYPPTSGSADVSFWYGTYAVTGVAILLACAFYFLAWAYLIPKWKGYRLRQEVVDVGDGAETHKMVRVPVAELEVWDAAHDAIGRRVVRTESGTESDPTIEKSDAQVGGQDVEV